MKILHPQTPIPSHSVLPLWLCGLRMTHLSYPTHAILSCEEWPQPPCNTLQFPVASLGLWVRLLCSIPGRPSPACILPLSGPEWSVCTRPHVWLCLILQRNDKIVWGGVRESALGSSFFFLLLSNPLPQPSHSAFEWLPVRSLLFFLFFQSLHHHELDCCKGKDNSYSHFFPTSTIPFL